MAGILNLEVLDLIAPASLAVAAGTLAWRDKKYRDAAVDGAGAVVRMAQSCKVELAGVVTVLSVVASLLFSVDRQEMLGSPESAKMWDDWYIRIDPDTFNTLQTLFLLVVVVASLANTVDSSKRVPIGSLSTMFFAAMMRYNMHRFTQIHFHNSTVVTEFSSFARPALLLLIVTAIPVEVYRQCSTFSYWTVAKFVVLSVAMVVCSYLTFFNHVELYDVTDMALRQQFVLMYVLDGVALAWMAMKGSRIAPVTLVLTAAANIFAAYFLADMTGLVPNSTFEAVHPDEMHVSLDSRISAVGQVVPLLSGFLVVPVFYVAVNLLVRLFKSMWDEAEYRPTPRNSVVITDAGHQDQPGLERLVSRRSLQL